jgi:hypothetical protein
MLDVQATTRVCVFPTTAICGTYRLHTALLRFGVPHRYIHMLPIAFVRLLIILPLNYYPHKPSIQYARVFIHLHTRHSYHRSSNTSTKSTLSCLTFKAIQSHTSPSTLLCGQMERLITQHVLNMRSLYGNRNGTANRDGNGNSHSNAWQVQLVN